jgi:hypothetical protein
MKVDLAYPKIPDSRNCPLKQCVAFEKYDGTNMHWIWENSWILFGTRRDEFSLTEEGISDFDKAHVGLEEAPVVFNTVWAEKMDNYIRTKLNSESNSNSESKLPRVVLFTEFLGKKSFAGSHKDSDEKFLVLFDVEINGKMLSPDEFLDFVSGLDPSLQSAKVIYKGKYSSQLGENVREGKYKVPEGIVVKGLVKGEVYMIKIKTNAYMEKLKASFKEKWTDYWE